MDLSDVSNELNQHLETTLNNTFIHIFLPIVLSVSIIGIFFLVTKLLLRKTTKNRILKLLIVFVCDMLMIIATAKLLPKIIENAWNSYFNTVELPPPYEGDFPFPDYTPEYNGDDPFDVAGQYPPYEGDFPFEEFEDPNEYVDPFSEEYQSLFDHPPE